MIVPPTPAPRGEDLDFCTRAAEEGWPGALRSAPFREGDKQRRGTMKNLILAGVAVALIAASAPADAQHETNKEQILGTWTVNTLKATSGDQVTYPLREHPSGFVTMSSRPKEFHLRALPEPCVTLSSHRAPDVRPVP